MSHRPLARLFGVTCGAYLLWNWSLSGNHGVLALVAGLSLPPLALACLWLLAVNLGRLVARSTRRARAPAAVRRRARRALSGRGFDYRAASSAATSGHVDRPVDQPPTGATGSSAPSPGKLAA